MKLSLSLLAASTLTLALAPLETSAQTPRGTCMISDPTGTPLNLRAGPAGAIVGRLYNGDVVVMRGTQDVNGKRWARITVADGSAQGWVFREFISCRN